MSHAFAPDLDGALPFALSGARLTATPSGALWWDEARILAVADLHLGKSERVARRGGALLPPYETRETLLRLSDEIARRKPEEVICLGDSFDDDAAATGLDLAERETLSTLMAGRRWTWISGNHDPGPIEIGGGTVAVARRGGLVFRHIAAAGGGTAGSGEVSAHYHPKARLTLKGRRIVRSCFALGAGRLILPAFGAYTGGLSVRDPAIAGLVGPNAMALLLGTGVSAIPVASLGR
jgi:DNA ligase-associated metallophosphoesterase